MDSKVLFSERQQFRQWWLWTLLVGVVILFITLKINPKESAGERALSDAGIWITLVLTLAVLLFFVFCRLDTEIREDGIYVRFFPLDRGFRVYRWNQLASATVRKYNPLSEYGGWGIRGFHKNRALNISGNMGIQLLRKDGYKLLIGTRKPEEAEAVLRKIQKVNGYA